LTWILGAGRSRTQGVAGQLRNWSVWSSAELAQMRFSDDGAASKTTSLAASNEETAKKEN